MNDSTESGSSPNFIAARSAMGIAQRAAKRPNNEAPGLPIALQSPQGVVVLVFFLTSSGDPAAPNTSPPSHTVKLDHNGAVLSAGPMTPEEIDALRSGSAEQSVGNAETLNVDSYIAKRSRFLDISPAVWSAFQRGATKDEAEARELVANYWWLFKAVTRSSDSAFYLRSSPAFFAWVQKLGESH